MNYYNEWDKGAAAWLRELIKQGHIPFGVVDERSITEVKPEDLDGFAQCHFFAGIGGWPLALRLAGVPEDTPLWTGSPPCQPFSAAGKQLGQFDPRHLAPVFLDLISECCPPVIFGEQVAAAIAKSWMCDLQAHLEREGYAVGFAVLPACSVGAPHKRERLFFGAHQLADTTSTRHLRGASTTSETGRKPEYESAGKLSTRPGGRAVSYIQQSAGLGGTDSERLQMERRDSDSQGREGQNTRQAGLLNGTGNKDCHENHGFWSDADWLGCRDGKFRPVEAWTQQVVDGFSSGMGHSGDPCVAAAFEEIGFPLGRDIPARVARLRGYGNAIVPQVAAEFVKAFMEAVNE